MATTKSKQPDPEAETEGEPREYEKRSQPIEVKGLPEGVRAILRLKPWRDAKEWSAYIYRREADKARPGRVSKVFLKRVYNTEVEESYLQANFPRGGKFSIIYNVPHPEKPGDVQIHSDDFDIEPIEAAGIGVAPSAAPLPVGAAAPMGAVNNGLSDGIHTLRALAEVAAMLKSDQAPAAPAWMERMYQEKLKRIDVLEEKLERKLGANMIVHSNKPDAAAQGGTAWPEFLQPFLPQIKAFGIQTLEALASKLMGSGVMGSALRSLVVSNPQFQAIWMDEARRNEAASAIIGALGEAGENLVSLLMQEMQGQENGGPQ